ncbi:MAG: hypothetical protein ACI837_000254 [Crocinitomicaceae bacterium]|jgi:hypothetical protein
MKKYIFALVGTSFTLLISCGPAGDTVEVKKGWRETKSGLFVNEKGDIAFATDAEIAFTPKEDLEAERCPNNFLTTFGTEEDKTQLKREVDTLTFEEIGADFYKDKNHIYSHYAMCDGGYFRIFSDDTTGFKLLGNRYAKHQSTIYYGRTGAIDADAGTFKVLEGNSQVAKDMYGYFALGESIAEEELKEDIGEAQFEKLENL